VPCDTPALQPELWLLPDVWLVDVTDGMCVVLVEELVDPPLVEARPSV
jgi:hypothetical protein